MSGKNKNHRQAAHRGNAPQGEGGAYLVKEANKVQPPFDGMGKEMRMDRLLQCEQLHNDKLLITKLKTRLVNMEKQLEEECSKYQQIIDNKDLEMFLLKGEVKGQLTAAQFINTNMREKLREIEEQLASTQDANKYLEGQLASTQDANKYLEGQLASTQDAYRHLEEQLQDTKKQLVSTQDAYRHLEGQLASTQDADMQLEQLKEQLRHAHEQLTSTQDAKRLLEEQLSSNQDVSRHLEEQLQDTKEQLVSFQDSNRLASLHLISRLTPRDPHTATSTQRECASQLQ